MNSALRARLKQADKNTAKGKSLRTKTKKIKNKNKKLKK